VPPSPTPWWRNAALYEEELRSLLQSSLDPAQLTQAIHDTLAELAAMGAPATWALSGRDGSQRARAALLLLLALPGSASLDGSDDHAVQAEETPPDSMLVLYRDALSARGSLIADAAPTAIWLGGPDGVLAFSRGNFGCTVNLADQPVPVIGPVLLASAPIADGVLSPLAAVWTSGLPGVDQAAQYTVHEGW
jgi:hypothetical protein